MKERDLRILPRLEDGLSFLYAEHAIVERRDSSIALFTEQGETCVPAASLALLALGPGTRITHAAMVALADCGTSVLWLGEDGSRFYASGLGKTRGSANLMAQAAAWADPTTRERVVRRLYLVRFGDELPLKLTLPQIRGKEGARVRDAYARASRESGVPWAGRRYDRGDWSGADPVNRALSAGNALLYGVAHAAIVATGRSPGLGFIHVGKALSFAYDLADLYKVETTIPAAFEAARDGAVGVERRVRAALRERLAQAHVLQRMARDMDRIFTGLPLADAAAALSEPEPELTRLWDPRESVLSGTNHAGDDTAGGADGTSG